MLNSTRQFNICSIIRFPLFLLRKITSAYWINPNKFVLIHYAEMSFTIKWNYFENVYVACFTGYILKYWIILHILWILVRVTAPLDKQRPKWAQPSAKPHNLFTVLWPLFSRLKCWYCLFSLFLLSFTVQP